jgi:hypothetical protein
VSANRSRDALSPRRLCRGLSSLGASATTEGGGSPEPEVEPSTRAPRRALGREDARRRDGRARGGGAAGPAPEGSAARSMAWCRRPADTRKSARDPIRPVWIDIRHAGRAGCSAVDNATIFFSVTRKPKKTTELTTRSGTSVSRARAVTSSLRTSRLRTSPSCPDTSPSSGPCR